MPEVRWATLLAFFHNSVHSLWIDHRLCGLIC